MKDFIPFCEPTIEKEEIDEVTSALKEGWVTMGPRVDKFENSFKDYINVKGAVAVSSCTAALALSLTALGIKKGDEVITTPLTFASVANEIIHRGAKPVFVDIDKEVFTIDPKEIEENITDKTKAIIPVHYAGHPCDMDKIMKIANDNNLYVIEDCAHSPGALYKNKQTGSFGDFGNFSFYSTKNITTGDGGMITTNNEEIIPLLKKLRLHGMSKDAWKRYEKKGTWYYEINELGFKSNMTDIQAALGLAQLKKIDDFNKKRREQAEYYIKNLKDINAIILQKEKDNVYHVRHLFPILLKKEKLKISRNEFIEKLKEKNIGTSVHFIPLHFQPLYQKMFGYKKGDFVNTEYVYERLISLPIYPKLTIKQLDYIINSIKEVITSNTL